MKFQKLRVAGFKSFVEAAEFVIEPGLTGVVGPNGCGKSNLVEALRWVMGETSYKNMRASGMDDVVFAGSANRPARNIAEVVLVLDNEARTAPVGFNDADVLEISRRLARQAGSSYRINGREVRARDVQVLFADAATGARSAAMVRQGQIGEIIAARPQARRRILEDAAGIGGLHSRRHEAELRLKAADTNLQRVEDILQQLETQVDGLRRQARQSRRYAALSADIRRNEALVHLIAYRSAEAQVRDTRRQCDLDLRGVGEATRRQAEAERLQALASSSLPHLRDAESKAASVLQSHTLAREVLAGEEQRIKQRASDLGRRIGQLDQTLSRERRLLADADAMLASLRAEAATLGDEAAFAATEEEAVRLRLADAEAALVVSEASFQQTQAALADVSARRQASTRTIAEEIQRGVRLESELERVEAERAEMRRRADDDGEGEALEAMLDSALAAAEAAEQRVRNAEDAHAAARAEEARRRAPAQEAERQAQRLEIEVATLRKLLDRPSGRTFAPVVDELTVEHGLEAALGVALGDDLDASTNAEAPAHWMLTIGSDAVLPRASVALSTFVKAPRALQRRLAQIGVVDQAMGAALQATLAAGQRLVSKEGDLWRWDGFTAAAEAPTPAARRLAEKNRLGDLSDAAEAARDNAAMIQEHCDEAQLLVRAAAASETEARRQVRPAMAAVETVRGKIAGAERARIQMLARLSVLDEAESRLRGAVAESEEKRRAATAAQAALGDAVALTDAHERARAAMARDRADVAEARAGVQGLAREAAQRTRRRRTIETELRSWEDRRGNGDGEITALGEALEEAKAEREDLEEAPGRFAVRRRALAQHIEGAETALREASDRRVEAESAHARTDREARAALEALGRAREDFARIEAHAEAAERRRLDIVHAIDLDLGCGPEQLVAMAGVTIGTTLPDAQGAERALEGLRQDRERLGAVNLRADKELTEIETTRDGLQRERDDLVAAVARLRQAILTLNREGRERLSEAFTKVDGHFRALFGTLFGGGTARLQLVDAEDPLEAGLEIMACPPGKKPSTMTLLSGGEQALTALALIFAVFLTNPSPICVLDEVDAPLDDANVERFCDLLDDMVRRTDTRFIAITHNPITMARMNRLFGVTMAERGVSTLVSVDLETAEQYREAG